MIIKDLNRKDAALNRKKRPFIEISWTCYFHLHLGRIIRANFNKSHRAEIAETKPLCSGKTGGTSDRDYFFSFTQFPRCNSKPVVSREQQCFQDDAFFFYGPSGEEKWSENPILESHIPA